MNDIGHHGEKIGRRLGEFLLNHPLFGGDESLVAEAELCTELIQLGFDDILIGTGREDSDLYLLFSGAVDIVVDGREVARRHKGDTVGEMELVAPEVKRVATVVAHDKTIVGRISESAFTVLADRHPVLWRNIAAVLVRRLIEETKR